MAALTHFVKQDFTARTITASVYTEETNYTVSWSDLTNAGFANGDVVGILITLRSRATTNTTHAWISPRIGSSFAAAVSYTHDQRIESAATTSDTGHAFLAVDQITLATNDNLYIATRADSTDSIVNDDFTIFIFKISDLGSANHQFAYTTPSGDASTSPTDGASITLPAGDWLIFAATEWLDDSTSADAFMTILVGGSEVQRVSVQGEDTANVINLGAMVYAPGLSADTVAKIQYWVGTGSTHDCDYTTIMAIRLDAFQTKWGVHSTNTVTHSALDTYQECAGKSDFTPATTGPVFAICFPKHAYSEATKRAYGRIQVGGSDWPAAGVGRTSILVNGPATAHQAPLLAGYGTLNESTAYDFDFDIAEDNDINPTYNCTQQDAVIFSLELAPSGTLYTFSLTPTGESLTSDAIANVLRAISSASTGESETAAPVLSILRSLSASISGESDTSAAVLNVLRLLAQTPSGESLTSDIALEIVTAFQFLISGESDLSQPVLSVLRTFASAASGESETSSAILNVLRLLASAAIGESELSNAELSVTTMVLFSLLSQGESDFSIPALTVLRNISVAATGESDTSAFVLSVLRQLAISIVGESELSAADLALIGEILFSFAVAGESLTSDSALLVLRGLSIAAEGESIISDPILGLIRAFVLLSVGDSSTTDVAVLVLRELSVLARGETAVSDVSMLLLRTLSLVSIGESSTSDLILPVLRLLTAVATGESQLSSIEVATMVLGLIDNPGINLLSSERKILRITAEKLITLISAKEAEEQTAQRGFIVFTPEKKIERVTPEKEISVLERLDLS